MNAWTVYGTLLIVGLGMHQGVSGDELDTELVRLSREVLGGNTDFSKVAPEYLALLDTYSEPEEAGRICTSRFSVYTSVLGYNPSVAMEFSKMALSYPLSPQDEMEVCLGTGAIMEKIGKERGVDYMPSMRREAATYYFRGLGVLKEEEMENLRKESDMPHPVALLGSGPEYERMKAENQKRRTAMQARRKLEEFEECIEQLEVKIYLLYSTKPYDIAEATQFARSSLVDEGRVDAFLERLQVAIDEREGKKLEGPSALRPRFWPSPESK